MNISSLSGVFAATLGVGMALAPLLQAWRVHHLADSSEVSQTLFAVMLVNALAWVLRGFVTLDLVLIVPNVVGFLTASATLLVVRRHRHDPRLGEVGIHCEQVTSA
jgi:MtN3 and saliva related transmembrane protein